MTLLTVDDVHVAYRNGAIGVDGITFELDEGGILGLTGPNGAGKTSTLRAIAGFTRGEDGSVTRGTVLIGGEDVTGYKSQRMVERRVCLVPAERKVFPSLTVEENLRLRHSTRKVQMRNVKETAYALFPILEERKAQRAGFLSGGEQQMLALARSLLLQPQVLLIDELSFGLAPVAVVTVIETLSKLRLETGISMVVVEQKLNYLDGFVDRCLVMSPSGGSHLLEPKELAAEASAQLDLFK